MKYDKIGIWKLCCNNGLENDMYNVNNDAGKNMWIIFIVRLRLDLCCEY